MSPLLKKGHRQGFQNVIVVAAVLVAVGVISAGLGMFPGLQFGGTSVTILPCGQLPGRAVPSQGTRHLSYLGEQHESYNSSPPTSGPHMPWMISVGVYSEAIPDEYQVHLLEHGNVLVQYPTDTPADTRDALEQIARWRPDKVVVAPNPALSGTIGVTAWQRIDLLDRFDDQRIRNFVTALAGRYDHGWQPGAGDCLNG
ncbi:DUF3105 domain-containing protein [Lentzea sp. NPDC004789]